MAFLLIISSMSIETACRAVRFSFRIPLLLIIIIKQLINIHRQAKCDWSSLCAVAGWTEYASQWTTPTMLALIPVEIDIEHWLMYANWYTYFYVFFFCERLELVSNCCQSLRCVNAQIVLLIVYRPHILYRPISSCCFRNCPSFKSRDWISTSERLGSEQKPDILNHHAMWPLMVLRH